MCGFSTAANSFAETELIAKYYPEKEEREKKLETVRNAGFYSVMIAAAGICLMYTFGYFLAAFMFIGIMHCIISPICYWRQRVADIKYQELNPAAPVEVKQNETEAEAKARAEAEGAKKNAQKQSENTSAQEIENAPGLWEAKPICFKDLWRSKYFPMALLSFARFQMSFYFVLVILMPMIVSYHGLTADKAVIAYFVAPVSYVILLPVITWSRDGGHL
jgi:hypothetical protein